MKKDLPIYDIKLSDDTQGVGFISLVDEPAIGVDWIKLAKQEVEEPIELFMSLTGDGLCFGCPPNGDGTRVNGEPDARCKGDGSGKTGGTKGGSKASPKSGVEANRAKIESFENGRWDENGEQGMFVLGGKEVKGIIVGQDEHTVFVNATKLGRIKIEDLQKMTFTHNHPNGAGFSPNDLSTILQTGVGEMRAVGTEKTERGQQKVVYEVRTKGKLPVEESDAIAKEYNDLVRSSYSKKSYKDRQKESSWSDHIHETMSFMANKYPQHFIGYKRTYIK